MKKVGDMLIRWITEIDNDLETSKQQRLEQQLQDETEVGKLVRRLQLNDRKNRPKKMGSETTTQSGNEKGGNGPDSVGRSSKEGDQPPNRVDTKSNRRSKRNGGG